MAVDAIEHAAHHVAHVAVAPTHSEIPELPNVITVLSEYFHGNPLVGWLHRWENLVFSLLVAAGLCVVAWRYGRKPSVIPRGGQNVLEVLVESIDAFVQRVIGPAGREHTPFIGTLFLYIWMSNLSGLLPGCKSSTANLNTTVGLALVVFCYVQWVRVKTLGVIKYLDHMAGSPRFDDIAELSLPLKLLIIPIKGFVMIVLFLLELVGEFVKPISLSLRLGFNVFAEDVLLAVLVGLGIAAGVMIHLPLPIQLFVVPLVLIFSTVQALVFSLLSSVYIALMLPQGEHH
ncbi:MAG: F0F1 ATP synthase subunit A [Candidatus Omnitrophica bacterium]|nr:F0F1 ATP synthase subunit A [Candidatus Omnitrophota bacterium]